MTDIQGDLQKAVVEYRLKYGLPADANVVVYMPRATYQRFWESIDDPNPLFFVMAFTLMTNIGIRPFDGEFQHDLLADYPELIFDAYNITAL